MTSPSTNFLGIPIDGDIGRGEKRANQKPLTELEPLIRALLDDDGMVEFGWRQYTPYFNDGDACTFRVGEPWFRTVAEVEATTRQQAAREYRSKLAKLNAARATGVLPDYAYEEGMALLGAVPTVEEDDEDWDEEDTYRLEIGSHPSLGDRPSTYNHKTREYEYGPYEGPDEARYDRCWAFHQALDSGEFENVLLGAFGDHCTVIVRKDRITVSEYSHD